MITFIVGSWYPYVTHLNSFYWSFLSLIPSLYLLVPFSILQIITKTADTKKYVLKHLFNWVGAHMLISLISLILIMILRST